MDIIHWISIYHVEIRLRRALDGEVPREEDTNINLATK